MKLNDKGRKIIGSILIIFFTMLFFVLFCLLILSIETNKNNEYQRSMGSNTAVTFDGSKAIIDMDKVSIIGDCAWVPLGLWGDFSEQAKKIQVVINSFALAMAKDGREIKFCSVEWIFNPQFGNDQIYGIWFILEPLAEDGV